MRLEKILKGIRLRAKVGDMEIKGISYSSKNCKKDSLFVALKGATQDGHAFAADAYKRGARAFIVQRDLSLPSDANVALVKDSRRALSVAAANFYNNPSLKLKVFGVVGTNGKTTTSYILESILNEARLSPGVIGTINYRYANKTFDAVNTTPESLDLQRMMSEMLECDTKSVVLEVSSHALHQGRTERIYFDAGIFTNLTQDHLDYHLNMRNYFLSKRRFFSRTLKMSRIKKYVWAAVNIDDHYGAKLFNEFDDAYKIIPFSMKKCAGVYLKKQVSTVDGLSLTIHTPAGLLDIDTSLTGEFNIYNILGAVALAVGEHIPLKTITRGIERLKNVPGRLQKINTDSGAVFVDYAHTPDALKRVIEAVRALGVTRVITLFGCGGDRDRTKRAKMGEISRRLSDISIVTSDNPRNEEPKAIIDEVLKPFISAGTTELIGADVDKKGYMSYVDREEAIACAVSMMRAGDAVIIAGKGHEDYQIIKGEKRPFDDIKIAKKHLKRKGIKVIR